MRRGVEVDDVATARAVNSLPRAVLLVGHSVATKPLLWYTADRDGLILNLFSPATWEGFLRSQRDTSGFQPRHRKLAQRLKPGDTLLCYMTKLSRWCGQLEIVDGPFDDDTPIFYPEADPFVVRVHVIPHICLSAERAVPIKVSALWDGLSFTSGYPQTSSAWAQRVKGSLALLSDEDAALIQTALRQQDSGQSHIYPIDAEAYDKLTRQIVRRPEGPVTVSVPEPERETTQPTVEAVKDEGRESIKIQALLAEVGQRMGMQIWIPKPDRSLVSVEWSAAPGILLERLPLNYDDVTLKTIERIDVLWLKGRSIRRAFEVEHTTSIYSGLLRMADLMALQPNMDIQLHIVAPDQRRDKVLEEISRPVFSLLERAPLSRLCTFLSYSAIRELAAQPNLDYLSDRIVEQFEEEAE